MATLPHAVGALAQLEALQLEGCPLQAPLDLLYAHDPLLLVALHDERRTELDLSHVGLTEVRVGKGGHSCPACPSLRAREFA